MKCALRCHVLLFQFTLDWSGLLAGALRPQCVVRPQQDAEAETLGVWLCRVRVLSGLAVLSGVEGRVRDLPQEPPGAGGRFSCSSCASPGRDFPVGKGTTRNLGSVSTPRRGGSYRPGRGCGSRRRLEPVSAPEVRGLGQWSGPPPRALGSGCGS